MDSSQPGPPGVEPPAPREPRVLLRILVAAVVYPLLFFVPAGRLDWPGAWAYLAIAFGTGLPAAAFLKRRHPDLARERMRFTRGEGVKAWDRVLAPLAGIACPLAIILVAALDVRRGGTGMLPVGLQLAGGALVAAGMAFGILAMAENRFFSSVVRIQTDRGHAVVSSGPYRFVRHPGYAGGLAATLGLPLLLGSFWAFVPAALAAAVSLLRTGLEDRVLRAELAGYEAYAARVRWRLVPGLW